MLKVYTGGQLFEPAKAEAVAKDLNNDVDDDFSYTVVHAPNGRGFSFIEVRDEDGFLIGKF